MTIPTAWMPRAVMSRIHVHWTAGGHKANDKDKNSYHVLVEGNGNLIRGVRPIDANEKGSGKTPASHTLNANTGAIGISMCCMGGNDVKESPFVAGAFPMTSVQWSKMIEAVATLAKEYRIAVTSKTILTHAEVEPNLQIKQRGKWDITRLAFDPTVNGAKGVGDRLRHEVALALDKLSPPGNGAISGDLKPSRFRVTGVEPSSLNFRDGPNGVKKGQLAEDTIVEKLSEDGGWWQVRTPNGFVGWVWSEFLRPTN
jgi:hypothetical protein